MEAENTLEVLGEKYFLQVHFYEQNVKLDLITICHSSPSTRFSNLINLPTSPNVSQFETTDQLYKFMKNEKNFDINDEDGSIILNWEIHGFDFMKTFKFEIKLEPLELTNEEKLKCEVEILKKNLSKMQHILKDQVNKKTIDITVSEDPEPFEKEQTSEDQLEKTESKNKNKVTIKETPKKKKLKKLQKNLKPEIEISSSSSSEEQSEKNDSESNEEGRSEQEEESEHEIKSEEKRKEKEPPKKRGRKPNKDKCIEKTKSILKAPKMAKKRGPKVILKRYERFNQDSNENSRISKNEISNDDNEDQEVDDSIDSIEEGKNFVMKKIDGNKVRIEYKKGDIYEGEMKNRAYHGYGVYIDKNKSSYEGEWKNGKCHGKGIQTFPDGNRFEGFYKNDQRVGKGTDIYSNGDRFEGDFTNGVKNGLGIYYYKNGDRYEGGFKADVAEGKGIEFFKDGSRFEGVWHEDRKHGEGISYGKNGSFKELWRDGRLVNREPCKDGNKKK